MKTEMDELTLVKLASQYSDNDKARELLESIRWPNGPVCPHCKSERAYRLTPSATSKSPGRKGLCKCRECRKQFTVTVGTIFEDSHIKISTWLMAIFILCSSKKGISAHQLHRMLGVTYKTAWFMAHRIRFAMSEGPLAEMLSGVVEIDETYVGGKPRPANNQKPGDVRKGRRTGDGAKTPVLALVQRDGNVRTKVVSTVTAKNLGQFIDRNIARNAIVSTDNFVLYKNHFYNWKECRHEMVNHSQKEYARFEKDGFVSHCNTAESFFSLIKRGVYGSFHHVSKEHLPRYCNEFAFRWNTRRLTDGERMEAAVEMVEGKRLTYKQVV
jgi:transposase-like protein